MPGEGRVKLVTATWNGENWQEFPAPTWVTDFRFEVERSMAIDPSWTGGSGIRRVLHGLTGEQLDQIGHLIDELMDRVTQPSLAEAV